jgi:glycosyltransferase involved in cell wall biosynthesis
VNILVLTSAYPKFDGDATAPFMASITEHVAARGHKMHVVLPEQADWARPPVEGNVHYHPYRYSPSRSWTPWGYAQSLEGGVKLKRRLYALAPAVFVSARRACLRLTASERFDVVHAHWVVPNGFIAAGVSGRRGIPLVLTLHGSDISLAERKPWLGRLARHAFAHARVVTAPSDDLLERASRLGATGRVELIPWGADPDVFRLDADGAQRVRRLHDVADNDVLVVGVGRFVRWKGFDDLITGVARARAEMPRLKLVLVGDGDLRGELESKVADLSLKDLVSFAGMAVRDDVNAYLSAADIVAVPSVHAGGFVDGQPTVALEAMAAAKPLVVTRVGGLPDLVQAGTNGLVVEERDPDALAHAIVSLARDPAGRAAMGSAGRARVECDLNWDTVADRLIRVYESASAPSRGRSS